MNIISTFTPNVYQQTVYSFDDYIFRNSIHQNILWEQYTLEKIKQNYEPGTDFIDIGANIGLITLGFIQQTNKQYGNIHCFECDTTNFSLLSMNLYNHPRIYMYPFALADTQKICHISRNHMNLGCNYIYETVDQTNKQTYEYNFIPSTNIQLNKICVLAVSLDSLEYRFSNKVGMIKIDVEGFEYFVLLGAKKILERDHPVIIIEIWDNNLEKIKDFLLKDIGYTKFEKYEDQNYIFLF
jgi:FkbM family methyltransferase